MAAARRTTAPRRRPGSVRRAARRPAGAPAARHRGLGRHRHRARVRRRRSAAPVVRRKILASDIAAETARLDVAVAQSRKQLVKLRARLAVLPEDSQAEIAPLLDAYLQHGRPLPPAARRAPVHQRDAGQRRNRGDGRAEEIAAAILAMARRRRTIRPGCERHAEEVREIARRLVRNLTQTPFRSFAGIPAGAVLVCEGLRPSDAALLDPARLAGVATDEGGADGHTAIMLRALGMPAVLGVAGLSDSARPGDVVVVDGTAGAVTLNPSAATPDRRAPRRHRLRPRAAAAGPVAPPAGGDAGRRSGGTAGQPGAPGRASAHRPVRRRRHRAAAQRVPVHEPRVHARTSRRKPRSIAPSSRRWGATRSPSGCWTGAARRTSRRCSSEAWCRTPTATRRSACAASACCCAGPTCSRPSLPPSCARPSPARPGCCCRW